MIMKLSWSDISIIAEHLNESELTGSSTASVVPMRIERIIMS